MPSQATPRLALPYLMAAQAQKHLVHNEALARLDALVQIAVRSLAASEPAADSDEGTRVIVAAGASGIFAGHDGALAAFQDGAWTFFAPQPGWLVWVTGSEGLHLYDGDRWRAVGLLDGLAAQVGINTTAEASQRLAVKSDAVLLSHDDVRPGSGDVRLKLNKATAARTNSLLFQTGFSGRAEIGTTGDDRLHIKVSADGAAWTEALQIDPASGHVGFGTGPTAARLELGAGGWRAAVGIFDRPAGQSSEFYYQRGGVSRWNFGMSGGAESGGNAGSDFYLNRYGDAGTYLGTPLQVTRSTGALSLFGDARAFGIRGATDNAYSLGNSAARWSQIWAANGVIQTSDARDKTAVERLSPALAASLVDAVDPVVFRWREGGRAVTGIDPATGEPLSAPSPGRRHHAGFLAQEVKAALDGAGVDLGAWGLADPHDPDSAQWLRPDQLIAVLWAALRETRARLDEQGG